MPKERAIPEVKAKPVLQPAGLTQEEKESIVAEYLGIHPKYLLKRGDLRLQLDIHAISHDGVNYGGWKFKDRHEI